MKDETRKPKKDVRSLARLKHDLEDLARKNGMTLRQYMRAAVEHAAVRKAETKRSKPPVNTILDTSW